MMADESLLSADLASVADGTWVEVMDAKGALWQGAKRSSMLMLSSMSGIAVWNTRADNPNIAAWRVVDVDASLTDR